MGAHELAARCSSFWDALARGERDSAENYLRELRPPPVELETYSYSTSPAEGDGGGSDGDRGTFALMVAPDTPKADLQLWNSTKLVGLVELDAGSMCLAKVGGGQGRVDFLACINWKLHSKRGAEVGDRVCTKTSHHDTKGKKNAVVRLDVLAGARVYAILSPIASDKTKQRRCFLRPRFKVGNFPEPLVDMGRHEILLGLKATPRAWGCVINAYPGTAQMWDRHCSVAPTKPMAAMSRSLEAQDGDDGEDVLSEVIEAPGLASHIKEYHDAGETTRSAAIEAASARKRAIEGGGIKLEFGAGGGGASTSRASSLGAWIHQVLKGRIHDLFLCVLGRKLPPILRGKAPRLSRRCSHRTEPIPLGYVQGG
jgi:hypothetical protein